MRRGKLHDLMAFLAVGEERSFTKAAAKLGVSQSALSHTMRGLEERLGVRLLTRTTRSVAPTEAGERLLHSIGPLFEEIEAELAALGELREKPAGAIRITATEYAADEILLPSLTTAGIVTALCRKRICQTWLVDLAGRRARQSACGIERESRRHFVAR